MSIHINRFIDRIKANDARGQRDFVMTMSEAKDLHADITKLLLALQAMNEVGKTNNPEVIEVNVEGGSF